MSAVRLEAGSVCGGAARIEVDVSMQPARAERPFRARQRVGVTALLTPGVHTQRVASVGRLSNDARKLLKQADRIGADRQRAARNAGANYVVLCVSTYPADLEFLDGTVARLLSAGVRRASRSWLIRAALRALDVEALLRRELASR